MSDLIIVHSLSENKLRKSIALGGFPLPSIAAMLPENEFTRFGNITFIIKPESVNPKDKKNVFFDRDIFSQRVPELIYDIDKKSFDLFYKNLTDFIDQNTEFSSLFSMYDFDSLKRKPSYYIQDRIYQDNIIKLMFLKSKQVEINIPMVEEKYKSDLSNDNLFREYISKNDFKISYDEEFKDNIRSAIERRFQYYKVVIGETIAKDITKIYDSIFIEDGQFNQHSKEIENLISDIKIYSGKKTMKVDSEKLRSILTSFVEKHDLEYNDFVDNLTHKFFVNPHFKNGNRKVEYNLSNIEKYMLKQKISTIEDTPDTNVGKISSSYSIKFKSFDDMIDYSYKLDTMEDRHSSLSIINKDIFDLSESLSKFHPSNRFFDVQESLCIALKNIHSKESALSNLKYNEFLVNDIPDELIDRTFTISQSIKNLTNHYFEGKPQKTLQFNDFEAVLLPKSISPDLVDYLKDKVNIHFYENPSEKTEIFKKYSFNKSPKHIKKMKIF